MVLMVTDCLPGVMAKLHEGAGGSAWGGGQQPVAVCGWVAKTHGKIGRTVLSFLRHSVNARKVVSGFSDACHELFELIPLRRPLQTGRQMLRCAGNVMDSRWVPVVVRLTEEGSHADPSEELLFDAGGPRADDVPATGVGQDEQARARTIRG